MQVLVQALQDFDRRPDRSLISRALVNGNAEKLLGHCLLSNLEKNTGGLGVLDKRKDGHEIDLMLFRRQRLLATAELKCTFSSGRPACVRAAQDASVKALANLDTFPGEKVDHFIVHFLNHADPRSRAEHLPPWILRKYPGGESVTTAEILQLYKDMDSRFTAQAVNCMTRRGVPLLEAVVVKLREPAPR